MATASTSRARRSVISDRLWRRAWRGARDARGRARWAKPIDPDQPADDCPAREWRSRRAVNENLLLKEESFGGAAFSDIIAHEAQRGR